MQYFFCYHKNKGNSSLDAKYSQRMYAENVSTENVHRFPKYLVYVQCLMGEVNVRSVQNNAAPISSKPLLCPAPCKFGLTGKNDHSEQKIYRGDVKTGNCQRSAKSANFLFLEVLRSFCFSRNRFNYGVFSEKH